MCKFSSKFVVNFPKVAFTDGVYCCHNSDTTLSLGDIVAGSTKNSVFLSICPEMGFFSRKYLTPLKAGSGRLKFSSHFFLPTSPINLKNVFLTFVLYFETLKYDILIQNENFKFSFPLKSYLL